MTGSVIDADGVMTQALDSIQDLAEQVREADLATLHQSVRRWVTECPEHAVLMLLAAACVVDPDETTTVRRGRLEQIMRKRAHLYGHMEAARIARINGF